MVIESATGKNSSKNNSPTASTSSVMVCHYPPGTSKWNPIEHRLFSFISLNWAAEPLRSLKKMLALILRTHTQTGQAS